MKPRVPRVQRTSKNVIFICRFDTRNIGEFTFSDQFLQLSAIISSKHIYGLGEHRNNFTLNTDWNVITLFNHDTEPTDNVNFIHTRMHNVSRLITKDLYTEYPYNFLD